ncbi:hypothetical protein D3C72_1193480 [compost metagenome]
MQPHRQRTLKEWPFDARAAAFAQGGQPAHGDLLRAIRRDLCGQVGEGGILEAMQQFATVAVDVIAWRRRNSGAQVLHYAPRECGGSGIRHDVCDAGKSAKLTGIGHCRMGAVEQAQLHCLVRPDIGRQQRATGFPCGPWSRETVFDDPLREGLAHDGGFVAHAEQPAGQVERCCAGGRHDPVDH